MFDITLLEIFVANGFLFNALFIVAISSEIFNNKKKKEIK